LPDKALLQIRQAPKQIHSSLEEENLPSSEDTLKPHMLGGSVGNDFGSIAAGASVKEENNLPPQQKEITQENRISLQSGAIEWPEEESNLVTQHEEESQGVSSGIHGLKGLALAKLYLEKGAVKGAKAILEELAHSGTPEERKEANLLLSKLIES
jgi:FimV-like protein